MSDCLALRRTEHKKKAVHNFTALYPDGGNATAFKVNEDGRTTISAGAVDQSWTIQPVNGLAAGTYTTDFVVEYNGGKVIIPVTFVVKEKAPVFFQLTVENGSGSGSYEAGQSVTITANAPAEGMTFDCWTATSSSVADASSTETTFTMPEGNAVVSATYKTVE